MPQFLNLKKEMKIVSNSLGCLPDSPSKVLSRVPGHSKGSMDGAFEGKREAEGW